MSCSSDSVAADFRPFAVTMVTYRVSPRTVWKMTTTTTTSSDVVRMSFPYVGRFLFSVSAGWTRGEEGRVARPHPIVRWLSRRPCGWYHSSLPQSFSSFAIAAGNTISPASRLQQYRIRTLKNKSCCCCV